MSRKNRFFGKAKESVKDTVPQIITAASESAQGDAAHERAARCFDRGYNCAQSVMLSAAETFDVAIPSEIIKGAAAFTGGIGYSGCTCGALVGASLFIGVILADDKKPRKRTKTLDVSGKFHDRFKETFKSTCCRALRKGSDFKDKQADRRCKEITAITASLLVDMVSKEMIPEKTF
ncbi:MAG: C-GCAxxG-C-C family (seleno)protein [Candidatus Aquicultor sp.]